MNSEQSINEARRVRDEVLPQAFALLPERMNSASAVAYMLAIGGLPEFANWFAIAANSQTVIATK